MYSKAKQAALEKTKKDGKQQAKNVQHVQGSKTIASSSATRAKQGSVQKLGTTPPASSKVPNASSTERRQGSAAKMRTNRPTHHKTGLGKEEIVSAALSSRMDIQYPSLVKTVRIFTSSTFTDTTEERNGLMKQVYPKLSTFCHERGYEFQVVDMRWGVRDEATEDHMTSELCMRELSECQRLSTGPNFVTFLGQKYGYRPFPPKILATEFKKLLSGVKTENERKLLVDWFKEDNNSLPNMFVLQPITSRLPDYTNNEDSAKKKEAQDKWWAAFEQMQATLRAAANQVLSAADGMKYLWSVTHDEIFNGILQAENPDKHCYWFHRNIDDLEFKGKTSKLARRFIDMQGNDFDTEAQELINKLKKENIPSKMSSSNITQYRIQWTENGVDPSNKEHANYLKTFMDDFYEKVTELITEGIKDKERMEVTDSLITEAIMHAQFAQTKCETFHGREELLDDIMKRLEGEIGRYPLVLCGQPGSGKTALMAKCLQKVTSKSSQNVSVIVRFIGTTSDSSSIKQLLVSVCEQMLAQNPEELTSLTGKTKELTMKEVQDLFVSSLQKLSSAKKTLYLFLDSLDQLDGSHKGRDMDWLPLPLPNNIHMIMSVIPDEKYSAVPKLKNRIKQAECFLDIPKLSKADVTSILNGYLTSANRTLRDHQRALLQDACIRCAIPLFLKLGVDQAIKWNSFEKVDEKVLQGSVKDVISKLFERLEKYHGYLLISHGLGYITASKQGLSQNELEDILSLDDEVLNDVYQYSSPPYRRLPPLIWVRVRADLKDYLTDRGAEGATVLQWYHREFREVAEHRYLLKKNERQALHRTIADYFLGKWANGVKKPYKDKKGNSGEDDRLVAPQPYFFKESSDGDATLFNHRKLAELPFNLVLAGDVETLKREVLCNFDWLYQKTRAEGYDSVLDDFIFAKQQGISDKELEIVSSAFRTSKEGVARDIHQLPIQLGGRLMSVKLDKDMVNVKKLIDRCRNPPFSCFVTKHGFLHPSGGASITKLIGHSDTILAIAVSPDKTRVVTYSSDRTVIVWDMDGALEIRRMTYEPEMVGPDLMCITKDNNNIICSCKMQIEIISIYGPEVEMKLKLDHGMFHLPVHICLVEDGEKLMAMSDKSLFVWKVGSWELIHNFPVESPPKEVYSSAADFLAGHKKRVIYFRKNTDHFYILDPKEFEKTQKYIAKVKVIEADPVKMNCYFAVTSADKLAALLFHQDTNTHHEVTLKVFDAFKGQLLKKFDLELQAVVMGGTQVCLYPKSDGHHVLFPNLNKLAHPFYLTELDLETGGYRELFNSSQPFYGVVGVDDDRVLTLSVTNLHTLEVKDLVSGSSGIDLDPGSLVTEEIGLDADNIWPLPNSTRYIAGSTRLNEMFVLDLAEDKIVRKLKPAGYNNYAKLHSDTCAMFMNHVQQIVAYDLVKMEELFTTEDYCNYEGGFASIDTDRIVYATPSRPPSATPSLYKPIELKNDLLKILNVYTAKVVKTIKFDKQYPIIHVKTSKNGEIIMCSVNQHVTLPHNREYKLVGYDLKADKWLPKIIMIKMENIGSDGGFRLTDDGQYVMFSQPHDTGAIAVHVWDVRKASGRTVPVHVSNGTPQVPLNYYFSEALKSVVVLCNGGDLVMFDMETLTQQMLVKAASNVFIKAHLSPDGRLFICAGRTINELMVFDLENKVRLGTLAMDLDVRAYTISADNNFLLFGGAQVRGMVQVYLHRQERGNVDRRWSDIIGNLKKKPAIFGKELIEKNYYTNPEIPGMNPGT